MGAGDLFDKVPLWVALAIVAAPGLWAVWKRFGDRRDAARKARKLEAEATARALELEREAEHKASAIALEDRRELIKIAQEAASEVIDDLREEITRLRADVKRLEGELTAARKEHAETVSAKDAKIALLEGQLRQALALAQSYEQKLADAGIPHEKPRQPFWGIEAGSAPSQLFEGRLP